MKKTFALVDFRISEKCEDALTKKGFCVIKLLPMSELDEPIASHTDMLTFYIENTLFMSKKYAEEQPLLFDKIKSLLKDTKIVLTEGSQKSPYPNDAIFNGLIMGKRLFCKKDSFSAEIMDFAEGCGYEIINVRQGYPACTVLKLSDTLAVTADRGMERSLKKEGISVILIKNGNISLPPYPYGFIGGAGSAFGGRLYFLGDIKTLGPENEALCAIEESSLEVVSLSSDVLTDLGGILFIDQDV